MTHYYRCWMMIAVPYFETSPQPWKEGETLSILYIWNCIYALAFHKYTNIYGTVVPWIKLSLIDNCGNTTGYVMSYVICPNLEFFLKRHKDMRHVYITFLSSHNTYLCCKFLKKITNHNLPTFSDRVHTIVCVILGN